LPPSLPEEDKMTKKTLPKEDKMTKKTLPKEDKLVKMVKGELKADVHPDMVSDYIAGGYKEVK